MKASSLPLPRVSEKKREFSFMTAHARIQREMGSGPRFVNLSNMAIFLSSIQKCYYFSQTYRNGERIFGLIPSLVNG